MKILYKFILTFILCIPLVACSGTSTTNDIETTESTTTKQNTSEESNTGQADSSIIDREGNTVSVPKNNDTIISLAPSITETLVNLGVGDKIIAVDTYSADVDGINSGIYTFDIMNLDIEQIIALKPDVIFVSGLSAGGGEDPFKPVKDMGSFITTIPTPNTIEDVKKDITFIGDVLNLKDEATAVVDNFTSQLEDIQHTVASISSDTPKTYYFEISPGDEFYTFGSNVFLDELLSILNIENIFKDESGWIAVSEEQIIEKNPDIILTNVDYIPTSVEDIKNRAGWDTINAVKNDNVFLVNNNYSTRPNENVTKALEEMLKAFYPELS